MLFRYAQLIVDSLSSVLLLPQSILTSEVSLRTPLRNGIIPKHTKDDIAIERGEETTIGAMHSPQVCVILASFSEKM
jgi:hypothetical protein